MHWRERMTERGWRAIARAHATRRAADVDGAEAERGAEWGIRRAPPALFLMQDDLPGTDADTPGDST